MAVVTDPAPNAPYQQGEPRDTGNLAVIDCRGADRSQSIPDNLVALFGRIRAWNYSAETTRSAVGAAGLKGSTGQV